MSIELLAKIDLVYSFIHNTFLDWTFALTNIFVLIGEVF